MPSPSRSPPRSLSRRSRSSSRSSSHARPRSPARAAPRHRSRSRESERQHVRSRSRSRERRTRKQSPSPRRSPNRLGSSPRRRRDLDSPKRGSPSRRSRSASPRKRQDSRSPAARKRRPSSSLSRSPRRREDRDRQRKRNPSPPRRRWDRGEGGKRWDIAGAGMAGGEREPSPRGRGGGRFVPPDMFSIHQGTVRRREGYGVFVEIPAMGSRWGLVHFSQIVHKTDGSKIEVLDEVEENQEVYVKVVSVDVEATKVGLSMKHVDQTTGKDLDPMQVKMEREKEDEERRKKGRDRDFAQRREEEDLRHYQYGKQGGGGGGGGKGGEEEEEGEEDGPKQEKNFGLSGLLAKETKTFMGVELKFTEPPEARAPTDKWRLYEFKGDETLRTLHLHRSSCFLFGRDRQHLAKFPGFIPTDHPSCSSQHAVIQFRNHQAEDNAGGLIQTVKPYIMDLQATNGTFLNGDKIEDMRYYELKPKDLIRFGNSSREYVLLKVADEK